MGIETSQMADIIHCLFSYQREVTNKKMTAMRIFQSAMKTKDWWLGILKSHYIVYTDHRSECHALKMCSPMLRRQLLMLWLALSKYNSAGYSDMQINMTNSKVTHQQLFRCLSYIRVFEETAVNEFLSFVGESSFGSEFWGRLIHDMLEKLENTHCHSTSL